MCVVRAALASYASVSAYHCLSPGRKCQEANEKVQELQTCQEARADQEQRIRVSYSLSDPGCVWWLFQRWSQPSYLLSRAMFRTPGDTELPALLYCWHLVLRMLHE